MVTYFDIPQEQINDDRLNGEHEANALPADVDWEALNRNRETLTLKKVKNETTDR
jgi:hypothetical protein